MRLDTRAMRTVLLIVAIMFGALLALGRFDWWHVSASTTQVSTATSTYDEVLNLSLERVGPIAPASAVGFGVWPVNAGRGNTPLLAWFVAADSEIAATAPTKITGYGDHGLDQAISRDGHGVSPQSILDTVRNPNDSILQPNGRWKLTGDNSVVVIEPDRTVVTTWATNSSGWRW